MTIRLTPGLGGSATVHLELNLPLTFDDLASLGQWLEDRSYFYIHNQIIDFLREQEWEDVCQ